MNATGRRALHHQVRRHGRQVHHVVRPYGALQILIHHRGQARDLPPLLGEDQDVDHGGHRREGQDPERGDALRAQQCWGGVVIGGSW